MIENRLKSRDSFKNLMIFKEQNDKIKDCIHLSLDFFYNI